MLPFIPKYAATYHEFCIKFFHFVAVGSFALTVIVAQKSKPDWLYLRAQAMKNMNPGAMFGMAVAIAGEVRRMPFRNRDWNNVTLPSKQQMDR